MKILIVTGPPYSGKGTQCQILKNKFGYKHISTGESCRKEKENKTYLGEIICRYEEKGDLVPDTIIKELFKKIIEKNLNEDMIILDGYPRTLSQSIDLIELIKKKGIEVKKLINIEVSKGELFNRAKLRAQISNRIDDQDTNIHENRIEVFEKLTSPGIDFLKSKFKFEDIDGNGSIEETKKLILSKL